MATQRNVAKSVDSILASKEGSVREIWNQQIYQHFYYMSGQVISVSSLEGRYYNCHERGSERDNYDIVTRYN